VPPKELVYVKVDPSSAVMLLPSLPVTIATLPWGVELELDDDDEVLSDAEPDFVEDESIDFFLKTAK
jgi:hypothetical protein